MCEIAVAGVCKGLQGCARASESAHAIVREQSQVVVATTVVALSLTGIVVCVLSQLLKHSGRRPQAAAVGSSRPQAAGSRQQAVAVGSSRQQAAGRMQQAAAVGSSRQQQAAGRRQQPAAVSSSRQQAAGSRQQQ